MSLLQTAILQSPEEYVGLFRSWAAQLQKSSVTLQLSCRDPKPLWPVEKCQGGSGSRRMIVLQELGARPVCPRELCNLWSYPEFRRMQKLCCVKQGHVYRVLEARVGRGTAVCWGSSERILAGTSHRAGVAPDGLGGFCSLLYPWQVSSDLLTHCKRKRWHIAASGNSKTHCRK